MLIRKAKSEESKTIAPLILLAMEDIVYSFIGENSKEKATKFLNSLIQEKSNQYSYENCWVADIKNKIVAVAIVYDGSKLKELRKPVEEKVKTMFNKHFSPEDETEKGEYYIDSVGVHPNQQGKGIGSKIFRFLIDEYVYRREKTLGLLVDKNNPEAKKLYVKLGFEVVGEKNLEDKTMEHLQFRK